MNYQKILKDQFLQRSRCNPQYSLRAFARDLHVAPSTLSEVFHGRHNLSQASAIKIADNLGLSETEKEYFVDLVSLHSPHAKVRDQAQKRLALKKESKVEERFSLDHFSLISDWYHLAILELAKLNQGRLDVDFIKSRLEITSLQAESALERLQEKGLVEKELDKWTVKSEAKQSDFYEGSSTHFESFHRQMLERAIRSLVAKPMDEKLFGCSFVAIPKSSCEETKQKINAFKEELVNELSGKEGEDSVYCYMQSFFEITQ